MGRAAAPRRLADIGEWDQIADVVIVGFGGAGACAALEARSDGVDVLLLERMSGGGGTTALSTGQIYLGGGTGVQRACGFEDSTEDMFRYLMASCGPGVDEGKIRAFCDGCLEHFDWLVGHGMPFKESYYGEGSYTPTDDCLSYSGSELCHAYRDLARPAPRGHTVQQDGIEAGGQLMRSLIAAVEKSGARIQTDTLVESLVVDDERRVVGVVAKVDQREQRIGARGGIVLCAGGFINNKAMVERYAPLLRKCKFRAASDGDDGRGIRMGMGVGGAAIRMDVGCIVLPFTVPKKLVKGIFVNRQGQRFIDESLYQTVVGEAALLHENGEVFLIVDNEIFERPFPPTDLVAVEDTIEDLEKSMKLPDGSLQHTVAYYNEHAARAEDPLFHKQADCLQPLVKPPFAALDYTTDAALYTVFTMGGLHTTPSGQVLSADGEPIAGLYAAGRTTSGIAAQGYSSGLSIADATFFGRRAGASAARAQPR
ncbi:MAG: FAD-dependent oxidoreductase [Myxococcales bacterium]|jgi:3-oxo-5alpha-steroid 4-dehydrogenase|nr:MAG: FAD-dependent oxidoreductase [Myxococcales bacterium]